MTEKAGTYESSSRVGVWSEVGRLRRVLVCSPGLAHLRLTPDTCDDLLFDDVIWVDRAKRDHYEFVTKMRDRDIEVLETLPMLTDVVGMPEGRAWVLDRKITDDLVGPGITRELRAWLDEVPAARLAELLIGGAHLARRARRLRRAVRAGAPRELRAAGLRAAAAAEHAVRP